ncbi:MAG TPA: hypothetical protein VMZ53_31055 [Kofleriaceae bacterium]|nr:hypothetical protein [Kofleriaceae bacterium]
MQHRWQFFRAGAVDQVSLRDGFDLLALPELDQKLWVALAMPTKGIDVDPATLELLDANKDGRIRVQDILAAVKDIKQWFKNPSELLTSSDEVDLAAFSDAKVVAAAKRMLADLGKKDAETITIEDTIAVTKAFADTVLNGDGIIIPASADAGPVRQAIEDAIACVGSLNDRSGKPGLDKALADQFFGDVDKQAAWLAAVGPAKTMGEATDAAGDALRAVKAKIEEYFTLCKLAAFDPETVPATIKLTSLDPASLRALPLAKVDTASRLPLRVGVNPAWIDALGTFTDKTVTPILGACDALTPTSYKAVCDKLAAYDAWYAGKPDTKVGALSPDRIKALAAPEIRAKVADLIAADSALTTEYEQITSVVKAVRFQRDFGRIVRNFVNFSDFYSKKDGVFQAGTLYLDARALHLCIPVTDAGKHGALAASSAACLLYCDITREGVTKQIAAALTNGDSDNVFVGRNGIFYDRDGNDWDATITKIVTNPISVREAFWAPYKKLVKVVEDNVTKRAAAADDAASARMTAAGTQIAHVDKAATKDAVAPAADPKAAPKKIDLGTVAAIGVAIGGIGTLVGALLATMFGLGKWLPLGILALLLMISGPSMLLAWLKVRRRNLGPILDANGWAINSRTRINVSFGAAMTELAAIPKHSKRVLSDPFADKTPPWRLYLASATLLVLAGTWYVGRLDTYLPDAVRSTKVLGKYAPAYKAPAATPAATPPPS